MNTIQIQNLSVSDLKTIISETMKEEVKHLLSEPPQQTEYLTRQETANLLRISLVTLHEWTRKGIITGYRFNSRVRYKRNEVEGTAREIKKYRR